MAVSSVPAPTKDPWQDAAPPRVRPKRHLGQHFLVNQGVVRRIVTAAEISPGDRIVEIGPGTGNLTVALLGAGAEVAAVEVDPALLARLREQHGDNPRLHLIRGDILRMGMADVLGAFDAGSHYPYKVVANLPYYITAPALRYFLTAEHKPASMVVMVQLEVAKNIAAAPGAMGLLSVAVQYYAHPTLVTTVSQGSFFPPPQVRSGVLRLDVHPRPPVEAPDEATFFQVVRAGFSAKRKQVHNALAQGLGLPDEDAQSLLVQAAIDPRRRAETLALDEWGRLAGIYHRAARLG